MERYEDKNGNSINVGDVLVYDEGKGYGQSIEEVIEHDGKLATVSRVGEPKWTILENQIPIPLVFYKLYPNCTCNKTVDAEIVDVPHGEAFTVDFAKLKFDT